MCPCRLNRGCTCQAKGNSGLAVELCVQDSEAAADLKASLRVKKPEPKPAEVSRIINHGDGAAKSSSGGGKISSGGGKSSNGGGRVTAKSVPATKRPGPPVNEVRWRPHTTAGRGTAAVTAPAAKPAAKSAAVPQQQLRVGAAMDFLGQSGQNQLFSGSITMLRQGVW